MSQQSQSSSLPTPKTTLTHRAMRRAGFIIDEPTVEATPVTGNTPLFLILISN